MVTSPFKWKALGDIQPRPQASLLGLGALGVVGLLTIMDRVPFFLLRVRRNAMTPRSAKGRPRDEAAAYPCIEPQRLIFTLSKRARHGSGS